MGIPPLDIRLWRKSSTGTPLTPPPSCFILPSGSSDEYSLPHTRTPALAARNSPRSGPQAMGAVAAGDYRLAAARARQAPAGAAARRAPAGCPRALRRHGGGVGAPPLRALRRPLHRSRAHRSPAAALGGGRPRL